MPAQRVLVADDDRSFLLRIKTLLSANGYEVDTVVTLAEAVRMATQGATPYDFIILDQRFPPPSIDGLDAAKRIRGEHPDARIILLTLFADTASCHEALDARIFRYIVRPFPDAALVAVLKDAEAVEALAREFQGCSALRRTLDEAGIGISVIDRSYRLLYMNRHQKSISHKGCRQGGICWFEYNPDTIAAKPCTWCPTKPAFESGKTEVGTTISMVDDKVHYFAVVASPILGPDGDTPIAVIEFVRDITDEFTADQTAIQATETDTRFKGILAKICALGFSRARLYELTEDGFLTGRVAFGGEDFAVSKVRISVEADPYWKKAFDSPEPIVIQTKGSDLPPDYQQIPGWQEVEEWMDILLRAGDQILGKISVDNMVLRPSPPGEPKAVPRKLTLMRRDEILAIAQWAANEIAAEREAARIARESERLRQLRRLSELVAGVSSLDQDLQEVVRASAKMTAVDGVHLRLCTDEGLKMMAGHGAYYKAASLHRRVVSYADLGSGSVQAHRDAREVVQQDASQDRNLHDLIASLPDSPMRQALTSIRSWASFPVLWEGQVLAVICLQSSQRRFFGPTTLEAARDFVAMIGPMLRIQGLIDELRATQDRLRAASQTAAHRINNPNAAIQSRVDLWRGSRDSGGLSQEMLSELMEGIATDSGRIAGMVRDLRRYLLGAQAAVPPAPVDIVDVVRRTVSGMLVAKRGIRFIDCMDAGLPASRLDPRIVAGIADELTVDACKALGGEGTYTVQARLASADEKLKRNLAPDSEFLRFEFCDDGPGVSPDKKEWIFGPFHTTFSDGSGLGLAYVRDSARVLGGVIYEDGDPGRGARFVLMVPVRS